MNLKNVYAGIMTSDIKTANKWYEKLLGKKADYNPMKTLFEWDFKDGGVLQLVEDKKRAGKSSITIMVSDIEETKKSLSEKNIRSEDIKEGEIAKIITVLDPENNRITFAENKQD